MMSNLEKAIHAFQNGKPVIIMDDKDRENEGDLCLPAQFVTKSSVNFFLRNSTGMICVACNPQRVQDLKLSPMTLDNTDPNGTPFTISVDLDRRYGTSTGVSSGDKAKTVAAIADLTKKAEDFTRPGHIFPLRSNAKGLYGRKGHTESSVELCILSGVYPACMIAELMFTNGENEGDMMRDDDCLKFAKQHDIPMITVEDIIKGLPEPQALLPIQLDTIVFGTTIKVYNDNCKYIVIKKGDVKNKSDIFLRIHSECITGDIFRSARCDCGSQLEETLKQLKNRDSGILIYIMGQEGRGIGFENKLLAYNIQDNENLDTVESNHKLYLPEDCRSYEYLPVILEDLGIKSVILHTTNPNKINAMQKYTSLIVNFTGKQTSHNTNYLRVKLDKLHNHNTQKV